MVNLERFPRNMRADLRAVVLKYGAPELAHVVLFSDDLRRQSRGELVSLLGAVANPGMAQGYEPTSETLWFENIMDYACDHIAVPDVEPSGLDTFHPDRVRPEGTDDFLEHLMLTGYQMGFDGHFDQIVGRPGSVVLEAASLAGNSWVSEVDLSEGPGREASDHNVRGTWEVAEGGVLTGRFAPNPVYQPSPFASSVLRWFPDAMRTSIDQFVGKFGSSELVRSLRSGRWLSTSKREELLLILADIRGAVADPVVAAWFGKILDYFGERWPGDECPLEPHGYYAPAIDARSQQPPMQRLVDAYMGLARDGDVGR